MGPQAAPFFGGTSAKGAAGRSFLYKLLMAGALGRYLPKWGEGKRIPLGKLHTDNLFKRLPMAVILLPGRC